MPLQGALVVPAFGDDEVRVRLVLCSLVVHSPLLKVQKGVRVHAKSADLLKTLDGRAVKRMGGGESRLDLQPCDIRREFLGLRALHS